MSDNLRPNLVVSKKLQNVKVDLDYFAEIMSQLGLDDHTILHSTIYIDSLPRLSTRASTWPKSLAKIRFPYLNVEGNVIRLSSAMLLSGSTVGTINHSAVHEIEHIAQIQRRDLRIAVGYLTILIFFLAGLLLGLTNKSSPLFYRVLIIAITAFFGWEWGYMFSWHEIQARKTSSRLKLSKKLVEF